MRDTRTWWGDAALVTLAVLLGAFFFADAIGSTGGQVAVYRDLAVGAIACAALLLRKRWPVRLAAVLIRRSLSRRRR